jgi:23S rRNA (cytidine1920-2'-O)/16S rRNA (cytidine1409-2'-O)-methyltransferase
VRFVCEAHHTIQQLVQECPIGGTRCTFWRMSKRRVDSLLAERGLADSRSRAALWVRAGQVRIGRDGPLATKPSQLVPEAAELLVDDRPRYVSRGGVKLENALAALGIDAGGRVCLDVGASTGGFTDCLLQRGAERVIALDVGHGQLDWQLRNDPRVIVVERLNARDLAPERLPLTPDLATVDVSFISLAKVLGPVATCLAPGAELLALVKPQFELDRGRVAKGGVVRSAADRRDALMRVAHAAERAGLDVLGFASSGLPGPKGNRETFIHLRLPTRRGEATSGRVGDLEAAALAAEPDEVS